ncbi:MAG: HD domain-containing protein [Alphaproteobacteria bacterium]|nr:HD domain-containing protein [Alphaproteobacteria bacterium]
MSTDFFNKTKTKLSFLLYPLATTEQVEAFLHYTEVAYKKDQKLPFAEHRSEYEAYSFERLKHLTRPKMDKILLDYGIYKRRQKAKIEAARFLEEQIMPRLQRFTRQNTDGYHGLEHTELVALRAVDIALALGYERQSDLMPVMLAAAIHDCARTDNGYNTHHGKDAANMPEVQDFLSDPAFNLSEKQKSQVRTAAYYHTEAMPTDGNPYDYVAKCLCDADRARLSWERGHSAKFFFTAQGNDLGAMNPWRVMDYLQGWDELMRDNGIRSLNGLLTSKYHLGYTSRTSPTRALFTEPHLRGKYTNSGIER